MEHFTILYSTVNHLFAHEVFSLFSISSALHDYFNLNRGMRYADIQYHLGLYGDSKSRTALILSLSCCDILLPGALAAADPFNGTGVHGACL